MLENLMEEKQNQDNLIYDTKNNLNNKFIVTSAEERYLSEFPKRDSDKLRFEVGKIAEMFVANQESNRYTKFLSKKASKNKIINQVQNVKETDISIIDYDNKKMKAQVTYKDLTKEYNLVFDMNVVSQGRLFIRDYRIKEQRKKYLNKFIKERSI